MKNENGKSENTEKGWRKGKSELHKNTHRDGVEYFSGTLQQHRDHNNGKEIQNEISKMYKSRKK